MDSYCYLKMPQFSSERRFHVPLRPPCHETSWERHAAGFGPNSRLFTKMGVIAHIEETVHGNRRIPSLFEPRHISAL